MPKPRPPETQCEQDLAAAQAEIANLQGQVSTLTTQLAQKNTQITSLQGQVNTLQGQVNTLQGTVSQKDATIVKLNADLAAANQRIAELEAQLAGGTPPPPTGGDVDPYGLYLKRDFGAKGDGTTDDTIAVKRWRDAYVPGKTLYAEWGIYKLTDEIIWTQPGVVVVGLGHIGNGPAGESDLTGARFRQATAGKWVFIRQPAASGNDFKGGRFCNIGFRGLVDTAAGGFLLRMGHDIVENCTADFFKTGIGFERRGPTGGDSSPLVRMVNCSAIDCMTGYWANQSTGAVYTQFLNCNAMKYTRGGIVHQGVGMRISADACTVLGGHMESHKVGMLIDAPNGAGICLTTFEDNSDVDLDLHRVSGTSGTRNIAMVRALMRVSSYQVHDLVIGGDYKGPIIDQGSGTIKISTY